MHKPTTGQLRQRADNAKNSRNQHKEAYRALKDDAVRLEAKVVGLEVKLTKFAELRPNSTVHRSEPAKAYADLAQDLRIIREFMMMADPDTVPTIAGTFVIYRRIYVYSNFKRKPIS
jgi:hypothetical protein